MAACAIVYLPSLFWALGLDQNIFAEIGSLLLNGKRSYVDAWDVKPPNVFYVYAFFEWIFGPHDIAVRLSDYFFSLFACASIFIVIDRQSSLLAGQGRTWTAPVASLLFSLTLLSLGLADTAQTESYSLFFIIGACILAQPRESENTSLRLFMSGAAIGIATFFKTSNGIFLIAVALEIWFYHSEFRLQKLLYFIVGFLAWCLVQCGILAAMGSLTDYLRIASSVFMHHTNEVSSFHAVDVPRALWTYLDLWSILSIAAFVIAFVQTDRVFLRAAVSPILLLAAGIGAVLIQNKGWGYHYVVVLPGLVWLCAISGTYLYQMAHGRSHQVAMGLVIFVGIATIAFTPSARRRIHYTEDAVLSLRNHSAYLASLGVPKSLYYPPQTEALAQYIESHAQPQDKIFIWGDEPGAYLRADRIPATRYVYSLLFTSGVISSKNIRALQDTLSGNPPKIIAIEQCDTTTFRGKPETSNTILQSDSSFSSLRSLIVTNYKPVDTIYQNFIIYARR